MRLVYRQPLLFPDIESCNMKKNHCTGLSLNSQNFSESRVHRLGRELTPRSRRQGWDSNKERAFGEWAARKLATVHTQDAGVVYREAQQGIFEVSTSDLWEKELAVTLCQTQAGKATEADKRVAKSQQSSKGYFQLTETHSWATWLAGKWNVLWACLEKIVNKC